jgi:K319L-like, PKD domain/IPT/TIG domain
MSRMQCRARRLCARLAIVGVSVLSLTACPEEEGDYGFFTTETPSNSAPSVFVFSPVAIIPVGATAELDGSSTFDIDGDELTFQWEWASRPAGSSATLQGANTSVARFTVDVGGRYVARLRASDGQASGTAQATVNAAGILTISPAFGSDGTVVTVTGANFFFPDVFFNGAAAAVQRWSETEIVAVAPVGAGTGPVSVESRDAVLPGPVFTYGAPPACTVDGEVPLADTYVRSGSYANTSFGDSPGMLIKGVPTGDYARKIYLVFDVAAIPATFTSAKLRLTVRYQAATAPRDAVLYGVIDNADWDPAVLGEKAITWTNAPRNDGTSGVRFIGQGATADDGVRQLVTVTVSDTDQEGAVLEFDVTAFVRWARGTNAAFSNLAPGGDDDGLITLLLAHTVEWMGIDGTEFYSREAAKACQQPQLIIN